MSLQPTFRKPEEVIKGWGKEVIIANNDKYCGKLLCFKAGSKFSNHMHLVKSESFMILEGTIVFYYYDLTNADRKFVTLSKDDVIDIPVGCPHQIEALTDAIIVEVSTHHEDGDSYRIGRGDGQK